MNVITCDIINILMTFIATIDLNIFNKDLKKVYDILNRIIVNMVLFFYNFIKKLNLQKFYILLTY